MIVESTDSGKYLLVDGDYAALHAVLLQLGWSECPAAEYGERSHFARSPQHNAEIIVYHTNRIVALGRNTRNDLDGLANWNQPAQSMVRKAPRAPSGARRAARSHGVYQLEIFPGKSVGVLSHQNAIAEVAPKSNSALASESRIRIASPKHAKVDPRTCEIGNGLNSSIGRVEATSAPLPTSASSSASQKTYQNEHAELWEALRALQAVLTRALPPNLARLLDIGESAYPAPLRLRLRRRDKPIHSQDCVLDIPMTEPDALAGDAARIIDRILKFWTDLKQMPDNDIDRDTTPLHCATTPSSASLEQMPDNDWDDPNLEWIRFDTEAENFRVLAPKQVETIKAFLTSNFLLDTARVASVPAQTLYCRPANPPFITARQLAHATNKAIATLIGVLDDPNAPADVKVRAALGVLGLGLQMRKLCIPKTMVRKAPRVSSGAINSRTHDDTWRALLNDWFRDYKTSPILAADLAKIIKQNPTIQIKLNRQNDRACAISVGKLLRARRGHVFTLKDGCKVKIQSGKNKRGHNVYQLEVV